MSINRFDALGVRDLRALVLLADLAHFGRVAAQCSISQPALSAIVKKAERDLGAKLFERSSRLCQLTTAGADAIAQMRIALVALEQVPLIETHEVLEGRFNLGFIPTIGPYYIPRLLTPLLKKYPKLKLTLAETVTERAVDLLLNRSLDAAVVAVPVQHPRIKNELLFQEDLVLAVHRKHVLAQKHRIVLSDLESSSLLLMEQGHCLRNQVLAGCNKNERDGQTVHSTSLETLLCMVRQGFGYTVVPQMVADSDRQSSGIRYIPFSKPTPSRDIGVISLNSNSQVRNISALVRFARSLI